MCEQVVARADRPFRLGDLWDLAGRLEQYGVAGFGWGVAWLDADGTLQAHRDPRALRDDPARADLAGRTTTAALVHLRRPSRLSTIGLPDTQPFEDPAGRYALGHNGDLELHLEWRRHYRDQGRIAGRADSEVAARWLEDEWRTGEPVPHLLGALHDTFGGEANLALVTRDGSVHHYAGNRENPVFTFRLGDLRLACTGLYSLDRSLFRFVAPGAADRALVPFRTTASP